MFLQAGEPCNPPVSKTVRQTRHTETQKEDPPISPRTHMLHINLHIQRCWRHPTLVLTDSRGLEQGGAYVRYSLQLYNGSSLHYTYRYTCTL